MNEDCVVGHPHGTHVSYIHMHARRAEFASPRNARRSTEIDPPAQVIRRVEG